MTAMFVVVIKNNSLRGMKFFPSFLKFYKFEKYIANEKRKSKVFKRRMEGK